MTMSDLILKKRGGVELTTDEIYWMINSYTRGDVPDYQMSAMLMAICFQDMSERETLDLTLAMRDSGDVMDLSAIHGLTGDKHSTGGVGDKTSLVLCPMLAACGVKMAKMSGRGLGHTGGTLDKLESIPGFSVSLTEEKFVETVNSVGFAIIGQTGELCPADKKLYALRDVTGTVSSQPLIVSSILSKKLAANADVIVLDVKTGSGAFMSTEQEAFELAERMVRVGRAAGKRVVALVSDMDEPLGRAVGNALEVAEAVRTLRGEGPDDLMELCCALGGELLLAGGVAESREQAEKVLREAVSSGRAMERFEAFVTAQGGDVSAVRELSRLPQAAVQLPVLAEQSGYLEHIDALGVGRVCLGLGGGRATKESVIDLSVGVVLERKVGDRVEAGESLAVIHAADVKTAQEAAQAFRACCCIGTEKPERLPFIKGVVSLSKNEF